MTVGQRIAQKRKELGLSQEGLGERLGVSRQAIYKWESDAALPEVEKLVNLSREFSVPVGWLLGEEDEAEKPQELTTEQLRVVEEIVGRYLAAQGGPPPPRDPDPEAEPDPPEKETKGHGESVNWLVSVILKVLAFIVALNLGVILLWRQNELEDRYQSLQNSISSSSRSVDEQIDRITRRVEEILQSQDNLTAERSAQVAERDYRTNTITISARAVPKTYVDGMTAEFILASGGETVTVPARQTEHYAFTAELTGPLTDDITVSVAFLAGDQRETQVVEQFQGLYETSLPVVMINAGPVCQKGQKGEGQRWAAQDWAVLSIYEESRGVKAASIRLALFQDGERIAWYKEEETTAPLDAVPGEDRFVYFSLEQEIPLEQGADYTLGALVTDEYGREWVVAGDTCTIKNQETNEVIENRTTDPSELIF